MKPKIPSPVRRRRGSGVLILLTLLMLLVLQGCGVSGGDGGGGNTVPVVVTMTMPGPTVARAPEGLFQQLWAKVHQVVAPMMAWAENVKTSAHFNPQKSQIPISETQKATLADAYGKLPLAFEPNQGQTNESVKFLARGKGYTLFLTPTEIMLGFHHQQDQGARQGTSTQADQEMESKAPPVVRLGFIGANPDSPITGREPLPTKVNYFIGNDPSQWHSAIPTFGAVDFPELYPGIDLHYYGTQRQMEFDWIVAPDADPAQIILGIQGAMVRLDTQGDLLLELPTGKVRLKKPVAYQRINGIKHLVEVHYVVEEESQKKKGLREKNERRETIQVTLQVAPYDRNETLIIDPVLTYSTFLGGSGNDLSFGIALDGNSNAYVTGKTASTDFPLANALQGGIASATDAFVAKLNAAGSALVYSTYLGGNGLDVGNGIAVDSIGNAYVTGETQSTDFSTNSGAFQTAIGGASDAFVTKLDGPGTLVYSTYLGGTALDQGFGIALDSAGNAYVIGITESTDFPLANALQGTFGGGSDDAFVAKLNATGSVLTFSTYLGGDGSDRGFGIAVDSAGNTYVTGDHGSTNFPAIVNLGATAGVDGFVAKLNAAGSALTYSIGLAAVGDDRGRGIAVDSSGNAYVTGNTTSTDFTTTTGAFQAVNSGGTDAFVVKLNAAGTLTFSTYLGGSGIDQGFAIAVDSAGNAYVTGVTGSTNFPLASAIQGAFGGGSVDAFVAKLNTAGLALTFSSYLGGSGDDEGNGIAVDSAGNAYVAGDTDSTDFPTASFQSTLGGGTDAFIAKATISATTPSATVPPSVGGSPSFIQSLTLAATANGVTLDSTTVNVTSGQAVTVSLDVSPGSNRVFSTKVFDGANGTGRCRFTASSNPLELTGGTAMSVTLNLATCPSTNALSGKRAYVANTTDGTVSVIDTTTNTVLTTVTVGLAPDNIAITPDGTVALVTNKSSNTLSRIDTASNTLTGTLAVGTLPENVVITPDGTKAYVTNSLNGTVLVINLATFSVVATITGVVQDTGSMIITPDGTKVYVGAEDSTNTISVISTATNTVTATLTVGSDPIDSLSVQPNGARVYITNVGSALISVLNPATDTLVAGFTTTVQDPFCCAFTPDSATAFGVVGTTNTLFEIATVTNTLTTTFTVGSGELGGGAITPDGTRAYLSNTDTDVVSVVNRATRLVVATIPVGDGPEDVAIIP